jgi:hypothetical protein
MITVAKVFDGGVAVSITRWLLEASQFFAVTPLPGDKYEIVVKKENAHLLDELGRRAAARRRGQRRGQVGGAHHG